MQRIDNIDSTVLNLGLDVASLLQLDPARPYIRDQRFVNAYGRLGSHDADSGGKPNAKKPSGLL